MNKVSRWKLLSHEYHVMPYSIFLREWGSANISFNLEKSGCIVLSFLISNSHVFLSNANDKPKIVFLNHSMDSIINRYATLATPAILLLEKPSKTPVTVAKEVKKLITSKHFQQMTKSYANPWMLIRD